MATLQQKHWFGLMCYERKQNKRLYTSTQNRRSFIWLNDSKAIGLFQNYET